MSSLPETIKEIRLKAGLSQDQFAKELGFSSGSSISRIERGLAGLSMEKLRMLADKFGTDPGKLLSEDRKAKEIYPKLYIGVHALIKNEKGEILVIQRSADNRYKPLSWDIPGGKMQYGEEIFSAVKREVYEETGLEVINVGKPLSVYVNKSQLPAREDVQIVFDAAVRDPGKEIVLSPSEHQACRWIKPEDLGTIKEMEYLKHFRITVLNKEQFKLVLLDFDGTVVREDSVETVSRLVNKQARSKEINTRYHRDLISGRDALRERLALLEGLSRQEVVEYLDKKLTLQDGVKEFIDFCNCRGIATAVFSGTYSFILEHYKKLLGFTEVHGTSLEGDIIRLKDTVLFLSGDKGEKAGELIGRLGLDRSQVCAVGNSIADIELFSKASLSFLINKKGDVPVDATEISDFMDIVRYMKP